MSETPTAERDAAEYRVLYLDKATGRWWSHTGHLVTDNPAIAEAWREQATHNGGRAGPTEAVIEARTVTPWTRVIPPGSDAR